MPRYDYTVFDNNQEQGRPFCRPYLAVRLANRDRHKNVVGLIDSGADISLAHADLATLLNIDLRAGRLWSYVGAVNGEIGRAYIHRLHLVIFNFSSLDIDIAFTEEIPEGTFLLGQRDFFESYHVSFDLRRRQFEITESASEGGPRVN